MAQSIAINGMGIIGRELFKKIWKDQKYNISLINDPYITASNLVYLLQYDSIYHDGLPSVTVRDEDNIIVDGINISFYHEKDVANVPFAKIGGDIVIECTGAYTKASELQGFLNAGAKYVLSTYPIDDVKLIGYGLNEDTMKPETALFAMPTIEEQVAGMALNIIENQYGCESAFIKAFAAYTNAQNTIDSYATDDFAKGRAGAWNIIPYVQTKFHGIGKLIVNLNGRVNGMTYRAPVIAGGVLDVTVLSSKITGANEEKDDILKALAVAANDIIDYTDYPLTSSDALGLDKFQILTDSLRLANGALSISVVYDNVRGQVLQAYRLIQYIIENLK